jgi:hypothetical protein
MLHEFLHLKKKKPNLLNRKSIKFYLPFSPPVSFERQRFASISSLSINVVNSIFESVVRTTRRKFSIVNGIC